MNDKHLKCAFTLAEVLITLGIIGVVAAMTIPTLVANYQKKVLVSQLQKTVATISNAAKLLMAQEQTFNLNQTYLYDDRDINKQIAENTVGKFLKTYFKVVKTCNMWDNNINDCININDYKTLDGQTGMLQDAKYCAILNNAAVVCFSPFNGEYAPFRMSIDVNGKSGPNVVGRDAFNLTMNYSGAIAESFDKSNATIERIKPENCGIEGGDVAIQIYGLGCYNKIVQDGWKMDY